MKLYLMRHTSVDVPAGVCYGQTDVPLKISFEQEVEVCRQRLATLVFDAVYTSPLSRCTRLAEACGYGNAIRDDRLKELHFGEWEMKRFDEIKDPRLSLWYEDYINVATTGGESFREQYARVTDFIEEIKQKGQENVMVFAHGGVLICALIYAGIIDMHNAFSKPPKYGELISIDI